MWVNLKIRHLIMIAQITFRMRIRLPVYDLNLTFGYLHAVAFGFGRTVPRYVLQIAQPKGIDLP